LRINKKRILRVLSFASESSEFFNI